MSGLGRWTGWRQVVWGVAFYTSLSLICVAFVAPVVWLVSAAFMTRSDITESPIHLIPPVWRPQNFVDVFRSGVNIGRYFANSLFVSSSVVLLNVFFCSLTGYSLAKFRYPGRNLIFTGILGTIMVPFNVIVVPLYLTVRQLGWIDTYQALIVPYGMSAFGIFLMRQFIAGIPDDYIAAARVDGASEPRIFLQIVLPLARPAITTLAILTFVANWDEFLWPLVVVNSDAHRTLPIGLARFLGQYENQWHLLMAGSVLAALPVVVLFLAMQRRFLESLGALSGIKG
jgi:multiple sugar transport system permease protein